MVKLTEFDGHETQQTSESDACTNFCHGWMAHKEGDQLRQNKAQHVESKEANEKLLGTLELVVNYLLRGFQSIEFDVIIILYHHLSKLEVIKAVSEIIKLTPNNFMLLCQIILIFIDKRLELPKFLP